MWRTTSRAVCRHGTSHSATVSISEEGPDATSGDAGSLHTENTTKAPSLASSKAEMDDVGLDSFTERMIEIPEPPLDN